MGNGSRSGGCSMGLVSQRFGRLVRCWAFSFCLWEAMQGNRPGYDRQGHPGKLKRPKGRH